MNRPTHCVVSLRSRRPRQSGLSLIELMVSVTIGLVILAALVALFVNTSASNRNMARANSMIENGRLAIELLQSDVNLAGFWGAYVPAYDDQTAAGIPTDAPTALPDPCLAYNPTNWNAAYKTNLIGIPVQAYDAASVCTGVITNLQANTDVLVVRHVETCVPGELPANPNCEADVAGKLYFQPSLCLTDTTRYVFDTSGFTALHKRDCTTAADKRKFVSNIYYVRDYAVTAGDGIPTLMRSQFDLDPVSGALAQQAPVAMIEDIQGFRVEFGIDNRSKAYAGQPTGTPVDYTAAVNWLDPNTRTTATNRGDGTPDGTFIRCTTSTPCTAAQLVNATAARIYVLVRSRDTSPGYTDTKTYTLGSAAALGPFNDGYKRHVFVTTVRLTNISGRRETP
jgi:type IV pilus assembly protein PilW